MLEECTVCAQACRVNRLHGELGICRAGRYAAVSSYGPHFGEEAPLLAKKAPGQYFLPTAISAVNSVKTARSARRVRVTKFHPANWRA